MNKIKTANQLRLAAELIETGHPFEACRARHGEWFKPDTMIVTEWMPPEYELRPVLAVPPDNRPLHNPDNLSAEQVGIGWRLILKDEPPHKAAEVWAYIAEAWQPRKSELVDKPYMCFNDSDIYRVPLSAPWPEAKPEPPPFQLPPPPPGMRWHREDGWKEGDLPQGYRPLTHGECRKNEDEWTYGDGNGWRLVANYGPEGEVGKGAAKHRTTRPLVFAREGKEWTYHKPGDPMPCDGRAKVDVCYADGDQDSCGQLAAQLFDWGMFFDTSCRVVGWRYAETTKQVELGPEDVPPGSVLKANSWEPHEWRSVGHVYADGVLLSNCPATAQWSHLMLEYQINRSIPLTGKWDATAWEPCSKSVQIAH